jgi:hypothetical protein
MYAKYMHGQMNPANLTIKTQNCSEISEQALAFPA